MMIRIEGDELKVSFCYKICYLCPTNIILNFINAAFINKTTHKLSFYAPDLQYLDLPVLAEYLRRAY